MNKKFLLLFVLSMITLVSIASAETLFNDTTDYTVVQASGETILHTYSSANFWNFGTNNMSISATGSTSGTFFTKYTYSDLTSAYHIIASNVDGTPIRINFTNPNPTKYVSTVAIGVNGSTGTRTFTLDNNIGVGFNDTNISALTVSVKNVTSDSVIGSSVTLNYQSVDNISNQVNYTQATGFSSTKFGLPNDEYNLLVSGTGYSNTNLYVNVTSNATVNYYLNSLPTTARIVYVKNTYGEYLGGITVEILRQSDSALLYSGVTDFAGQVQFTLSTGTTFNLRINASGYSPLLTSYNAIDNLIVTLSSSLNTNQSKYVGFNYNFSPSQSYLLNDTTVVMGFNVSSSYYNITSCNMTVLNNVSVVVNSTAVNFCNNRTGTKTLSIFPTNTSYVTVIGTMVVNGEVFSFINTYTVKYYYQGDFSLKTALESIANFDKGGFDSFGKGLFLIIVTIMILASAIRFSPNVMNEPTSVLLLLTFILSMWTMTGFLNSLNANIGAWTPVVLLSLITAGFYYKSVNER